MKVKYLLFGLCLLIAGSSMAQNKPGWNAKPGGREEHIDQNFCNTMMGIVFHVPYNFADIKGKELETNGNETRYASLKGIVGVETSNIVHDSVWRYEGTIFQGTSKEKTVAYYKEYAAHLEHCLKHADYTESSTDNTVAGLEDYPHVNYRYKTGVVQIELRVAQSEINGIYTIMLFVMK